MQNFDLGFSDDAATPLDCSKVNLGLIFQPTVPFSQFEGVEASGECNMELDPTDSGNLDTYSINYCIGVSGAKSFCSFSSDIARSNLNIPGYRHEGGVAYYTKILRNSGGEEVYVTISLEI